MNTPLTSLRSCACGGRPKITRAFGWWHIECKKCGWYPFADYGAAENSYISRVYAWNTRNEAIHAWETATNGDAILVDMEWDPTPQSSTSQPTECDTENVCLPSKATFKREEVIHLASLKKTATDTQVFESIGDAIFRRYDRRAYKFSYRTTNFENEEEKSQ